MSHEIEWEIVEKRSGPHTYRPRDWQKFPAIAVARGRLTFNEKFCQAWVGETVCGAIVLISPSKQMIGLRLLDADGMDENAYSIRRQKSNKNSKTCEMTCSAITKRFPDAVGHCFRAQKNVTGTVIEIELSRDNTMR